MNLSPAILPVLALIAIPQDPSDEGWSTPRLSPMRMRVNEVLKDRGQEEGEAAILDKLVELGSGAIPEVIDILIGKDEDAPGGGDFALVKRGGGQDELLMQALDRWPADAVVSAVKEYTLGELGEMEFDDQLQGMVILGRVGDAGALEPMFEIISKADPVQLLRPTVQKKIEGPLIQIFARDAKSLRVLGDRFSEIQVELWPSLARAIGANMRAPGIDLLEGMLGQNPKLDEIVLGQLSHLDARDWRLHSVRTADILRTYLRSAEGRLRKQAITSLGELRYVYAFDELAMMTDDVERSVQQAAARALRKVTGLSWTADSQEWQVWIANQRAWLARVKIETAGDVTDADPSRAVRAMRTLLERPVFRHQLTEIIANATRHPEQGVVSFACTALASLDSPYAFEPLLELLLHDSESVRIAAHASLQKISGQELPMEYVAWQDWIDG